MDIPWDKIGTAVGVMLSVVGLNKALNHSNAIRIKKLEDAGPFRSEVKCEDLMESCSMNIHVKYLTEMIKEYIKDQKSYREAQTRWMQRIEDRIDRK